MTIEQRRGHLTASAVVNTDKQDARSAIAEHIEAVTHSAKSGHANPAPLQFWSQPSHMHIDRFRFSDKTRAPGARQDPVSTHDLALVLNQNSEQVEFARRHLDLMAVDISSPCAGINP